MRLKNCSSLFIVNIRILTVAMFIMFGTLIATLIILAGSNLAYAQPATVNTLAFEAPICALTTLICSSAKSERDDRGNKPVGDYRKDLKAFVKRTKEKRDTSRRVGAVVDLCMLHEQLVTDSRFQTNVQLKGFRAIAADRLKKCKKEIELEMLRAERKKTTNSSVEKLLEQELRSSRAHSREKLNDFPDSTDETFARWVIEDMQTITMISGGPVRFWSHTGGNYGPVCDFGPDLVRLIETTINPDSWRANGGTGIIEYYQPLRILVISASSQVQDDVTGLLRTIRANGR